MSKSDSKTFRICIFFFGLFIIALAGVFVNSMIPETWQLLYVFIAIALIYLAFFLPAVLSIGNKGATGGIFAAGTIYYRGAVGFMASTLVLVSLVFGLHITLLHVIISQLIIIFVFLIYIYFACVTDSHIASVNKMEKVKRIGVDELRSKTEKLKIRSESLPSDYEDIKTKISKLSDDMRYLSPSDNDEAIRLENELISRIDGLIQDPLFVSSDNIGIGTAQKRIVEIELLIKERKAIY